MVRGEYLLTVSSRKSHSPFSVLAGVDARFVVDDLKISVAPFFLQALAEAQGKQRQRKEATPRLPSQNFLVSVGPCTWRAAGSVKVAMR